MTDPILNPSYNQGYPSPFLVHADQIVFTVNSPNLMYNFTSSINQGYPSRDNDASTMAVQTAPFPKCLPGILEQTNQGYPTLSGVDTPSVLVQQKPYPRMCFGLDEEILEGYPGQDIELIFFGAFSNVPTLIMVKIPKSVKYISDYAFYNTGLTGVRIARDCRVGEHAFPDDCTIEYYDD